MHFTNQIYDRCHKPNYTPDDLADILLNLGAVDRSDQPRSCQEQASEGE